MIAFRFCGRESHGTGSTGFEMKEAIRADGVRRVDLLIRSAQSQNNAGESQSILEAEQGANGRIFVRPLLVMDGNNRLPIGVGNEDFEIEGSRNGLIADHAGDEAVLAYSSEDACVDTRASRLHDFKI
jgi:hypothetical protein